MKEALEYLQQILTEAKEALEAYEEAETIEDCSVHLDRVAQSIDEALSAIRIQLQD